MHYRVFFPPQMIGKNYKWLNGDEEMNARDVLYVMERATEGLGCHIENLLLRHGVIWHAPTHGL